MTAPNTISKPKLLMSLSDASDVRDVTEVASQWYQIVRVPDRNRIVELIQNDPSVGALVIDGGKHLGESVNLLQRVADARAGVWRILIAHVPELSLIHALHTGTVQRLIHRPCTERELAAALLPAAGIPGTPVAGGVAISA